MPPRARRRPPNVDLSSVDAALASAPDHSVDEWLELGAKHEAVGDRYQFGDKTQREYEWALVAFRAALAIDPTSFEALYNAARLFEELGSNFYDGVRGVEAIKQAIDLFRRSLDTDEAQEASLRKDAAFALAQSLSTLREYLSDGALDAAGVVLPSDDLEQYRQEAISILSELLPLLQSDLFEQNEENQQFILDVQLELLPLLEGTDQAMDLLDALLPLQSSERALAIIEASAARQQPTLEQLQAAFADSSASNDRPVEALSSYADLLMDLEPPQAAMAQTLYEEAMSKLSNRLSPPRGLKPHELPALQSANCRSRSDVCLVLAKQAIDDVTRSSALDEAGALAMQAFQALDTKRRDWTTEKHRRDAIAQVVRVSIIRGSPVPAAWQTLPQLSQRRIIEEFRDDAIWTEVESQAWSRLLS